MENYKNRVFICRIGVDARVDDAVIMLSIFCHSKFDVRVVSIDFGLNTFLFASSLLEIFDLILQFFCGNLTALPLKPALQLPRTSA